MADDDLQITPALLLQAYAAGIFPMAEGRDTAEIHWVDPRRRGIFPIDGFHISRSLRRRILSGVFSVTTDRAFDAVIEGCAAREETWINAEIHALYAALFEMGHAHSVEVWKDGALVGGVYGVTLGAAFFGESMFSTATDASKVALAYLICRLKQGGFTLFDTQFLTDHLASLGAIEITRLAYHHRLARAIATPADFDAQGPVPAPHFVVQCNSQTS